MQSKSFISLALVVLTSLLSACAQLGAPVRPQPQGSATVVSAPSAEVLDLNRRVAALEAHNKRRKLAEEEANQIGRKAASVQPPPKSLACVRVPDTLMQSTYYVDFTHLMEAVYSAACLYAVDAWAEDQKFKTKREQVLPVNPSTKKK